MKTNVFTINNNKNFNNGADYSKILDDIILDTLMKNNSYIFENNKKNADDALIDAMFEEIDTHTFAYKPLKGDKFAQACDFLANYGKDKTNFKIPYQLNKLYRLTDGTPIIFYDDEIQIGTETFKYNMFNDIDFISTLKPETKKIIININIKL
jgi:hypothetical protein